jgi:hypothetical protein
MEITTEYKIITGASSEVELVLNKLSRDGWRPVTMSCRSSVLTVILENKIMEKAKLSLSSALADGSPIDNSLEEVQ